jgi:hypothetical protein
MKALSHGGLLIDESEEYAKTEESRLATSRSDIKVSRYE